LGPAKRFYKVRYIAPLEKAGTIDIQHSVTQRAHAEIR
jgi:hypothetical protein